LKANDWINYAQAYRYRQDGSGKKLYEEVMDDFVHTVAFQYYRDHLEEFNSDFRYQMSEFKDGNLFFEIMQQEIWNRAHTDSSELLSLYETNKNKYNWASSADAVIFFCSDQLVAKTLYDQLKKNPNNWRNLTDALSEKVVADSSRYEWPQIPNLNKMLPRPGMLTTPLINKTDNTASFAYIINVYVKPSPRTYNEAKGLVINDYQAILEEQWIKSLRNKYPVNIDQKVLDSISK
jgi:peptidyl-prolyl cis-trans isomerase SurA